MFLTSIGLKMCGTLHVGRRGGAQVTARISARRADGKRYYIREGYSVAFSGNMSSAMIASTCLLLGTYSFGRGALQGRQSGRGL